MEGSGRGLRSDVVLKSICNDGDERRKAQNSRCVDGDLNPTLPLEPTCSVSVLLFVFLSGTFAQFPSPHSRIRRKHLLLHKAAKNINFEVALSFSHGYVPA